MLFVPLFVCIFEALIFLISAHLAGHEYLQLDFLETAERLELIGFYGIIPRSRQNPKILGRYDAEIV